MDGLLVGIHCGGATAAQSLDAIRAAEDAGLDVAWLTGTAAGADPLATFAAATQRTSRIRFGTSVVPTFPRHPLALVQQALAIEQLAPGRLRLGVGPSHVVVIEPAYGIPFERPLQHLREYLIVLRAALQEGGVDFAGERITARMRFGAPTGVQVMASALRPNGFRVCGELAEGAISWVCPLPYLRDIAKPAMVAGAAKAGRPVPPLIAHVPLVVSEDVAGVREAARRQLGRYPRIPYYSQMFQDAGFPEAAAGEMSDALIDALVIHGDAASVKARLRELPAFGADELLAMAILPEGDPGAQARTLAVLGDLAAEA